MCTDNINIIFVREEENERDNVREKGETLQGKNQNAS